MNIDNINATIETIKHSKAIAFYMGDWITQDESFASPENECGTACCLAGYATVAKYGSAEEADFKTIGYFREAREFLGIDDFTAERLFIPGNGHVRETSKDIAISVLEHLRDTGRVLWDEMDPKTVED